jgi:hypothetical protein
LSSISRIPANLGRHRARQGRASYGMTFQKLGPMTEHKNKKNITGGDILEMMVRAGLKPASALDKRQAEESRQIPIISINGEDVQWRELEFERRSKKDKAA